MYYVALLCPPDADRQVQTFKIWMKEQFGCTVAMKSPAHITLVPPFWLEEEREKELLDTFSTFRDKTDEITIILNGFDHFGKRVLFVRVDDNPALTGLKSHAEDHLIKAFHKKIKIDIRPFHPHVTIANRDMKPGHFIKAWEYFSAKAFSCSFQTKQISLLKLSLAKWQVIAEQSWC